MSGSYPDHTNPRISGELSPGVAFGWCTVLLALLAAAVLCGCTLRIETKSSPTKCATTEETR